MQLWIVVIVCLAALQINSPVVEANSIESSFEKYQDEESLRNFVQENQANAGFADRVKDWFRRLKNRIFGRKDPQPTPPSIDRRKMGNLDNEDLRIMQGNTGGFFLDMSKVRFDPQKDWGFRVGNWYFIRKVSVDSVETKDWSTVEVPEPEWTTIDKAQPTADDRTTDTVKSRETSVTPAPTVKSSPAITGSQYSTTSAPITETTFEGASNFSTVEYSTANDATTKIVTAASVTTNDATTKVVTPASVTTKNPKDNETHKRKANSAEVIGPS